MISSSIAHTFSIVMQYMIDHYYVTCINLRVILYRQNFAEFRRIQRRTATEFGKIQRGQKQVNEIQLNFSIEFA